MLLQRQTAEIAAAGHFAVLFLTTSFNRQPRADCRPVALHADQPLSSVMRERGWVYATLVFGESQVRTDREEAVGGRLHAKPAVAPR